MIIYFFLHVSSYIIATSVLCSILASADADFVPFSNSEFLSEQQFVIRCVTLQVIDDTLLEDNELLKLEITADGGVVFDTVITILDTIDSESNQNHMHVHPPIIK